MLVTYFRLIEISNHYAINMSSWPELKSMPNNLVNYGVTDNGIAIIELISDTDGKPLSDGRTSVNTYTREMWEDIDQAILSARFDGDVSVILLTGHGEKFFSAGASINYLNTLSPRYKYFFCLHHIKIYNKRWNYFAGKSQKQIYDFQKNDFFEGRPTRPFSYGYDTKIKFDFEYSLDHEKIKFKKKNKSFFNSNKKSNSKVQEALKIFSLSDDFSEKILKKRYKELVKKYHPDLNRSFLNKDSKIKEINNAYNFLLQLAKNNHEIK